jgi:hypothetical protein
VVSFENDFVTLTFIAFGLYYILYFEYSRVVKKKQITTAVVKANHCALHNDIHSSIRNLSQAI